jgi:hypothetical protein
MKRGDSPPHPDEPAGKSAEAQNKAASPNDDARCRLPPPERVLSETEFVSPKGRRYRIVHSSEADEYDPPTVEEGADSDQADSE